MRPGKSLPFLAARYRTMHCSSVNTRRPIVANLTCVGNEIFLIT